MDKVSRLQCNTVSFGRPIKLPTKAPPKGLDFQVEKWKSMCALHQDEHASSESDHVISKRLRKVQL